MSKPVWVVAAVILVVILFLLTLLLAKRNRKLGLPPHEFAYGALLDSIDELSAAVDQFLSLPELDPSKTKLETHVGLNSSDDLQPLIRYLRELASRKPEVLPLVDSLIAVEQTPDQKQKAIKLVEALRPYRDMIRDEPNQDEVIVFIHYSLKRPERLTPLARERISELVRRLDTPEQAKQFNSSACPDQYLEGNINIYPLCVENTSWYQIADLGPEKNAPVYEVRFMGLRGIFRHLLQELKRETGISFRHLDGEEI